MNYRLKSLIYLFIILLIISSLAFLLTSFLSEESLILGATTKEFKTCVNDYDCDDQEECTNDLCQNNLCYYKRIC